MLFKKAAGRYTNICKTCIKNNYKFLILALKRYTLLSKNSHKCFLSWPTLAVT